MSDSTKTKPSLKQQFSQLDELLNWFDQPDLDVDQALEKFDHGVKLIEDIKKQLATLENKVTVLKKRFDQEA